MSIVQTLIGSIVTSGGGSSNYPNMGSGTYISNVGSAVQTLGTAYDPGSAVATVANMTSGWYYTIKDGQFKSQFGPGEDIAFFQGTQSIGLDVFGGFGYQVHPAENYAIQWVGYIQAPVTGDYNISLTADDLLYFWIGTTALEGNYTLANRHHVVNNNQSFNTNSVTLTGGQYYPIRMWFQEYSGGDRAQVFIGPVNSNALAMDQVVIVVNSVTDGHNPPVAPFSLEFVQTQTDYLDVAASLDFNLGTTWTIEFWSKAGKASTEGDLLTVMCQNFNVGGSIDLIYIGAQVQLNGTRLVAEPTPNQWTHVALVSDGTNTTVFYNGTMVYSGGAIGFNNTTDAIRIGARGPADFQRFDGKLALIRISDAAKYTATFTPTTTYGAEADTVLFLSLDNPLVNTGLNLLGSPSNFSIAPWNQGGSTGLNIVSTTELAPDGTNTAYQFSYKSQFATIHQYRTLIPGETYTVSVYAKSGVQMAIVFNDIPYTSNWAWTNYDVVNGFGPSQSVGTISTSLTAQDNGFYLCSCTFVAPAGKPDAQIGFWLGGFNGLDWTGPTLTLWNPSLTLTRTIINNGAALSNDVPT